jgi:hypothetical protein
VSSRSNDGRTDGSPSLDAGVTWRMFASTL